MPQRNAPTLPLAPGAHAPKGASVRRSQGRTERPASLALDRRSWEYRLLARTRAELGALIGPSPGPMMAALAERAAWLTVHVAVMDSTFNAGRKMGDNDAREYASLSNLLIRTLGRLGDGKSNAKPLQPSLKDYLAERQRQAAL